MIGRIAAVAERELKSYFVSPVAFRNKKFTRRYIQKGKTILIIFGKMNSRQKIITAMLQDLVIDRCARGHHFRDTSFDDPFCEFWIFQLIADGDAITGFHQFVQVNVKCMVWKSSKI